MMIWHIIRMDFKRLLGSWEYILRIRGRNPIDSMVIAIVSFSGPSPFSMSTGQGISRRSGAFRRGQGYPRWGGLPVKENYMYFNPSAGHFHAGSGNSLGNGGIYGGLSSQHQKSGAKPQGLVVGGTEQDPRIHITESLERCIASSGGPRDATFEAGALLPGQWDKYFNVDVLEVWGVGGDNVAKEALDKKEKQADVMGAARRRVQRVDKRQFLDDFQSGFHARGTGSTSLFQHRLDGSVRHDFDVDRDKEGNERPCLG